MNARRTCIDVVRPSMMVSDIELMSPPVRTELMLEYRYYGVFSIWTNEVGNRSQHPASNFFPHMLRTSNTDKPIFVVSHLHWFW